MQNVSIDRNALVHKQLSWTIFSAKSWSSTSLVTLMDTIFGKGETSVYVTIRHGDLLNIQETE